MDMDSKNSQVYINIYRGGINNDDYKWNISWYKNDLSGNYGVKTKYRVCTFINKNGYNNKFIIIIDYNGKFITNYRRNSNKEVS